MPFCKVFLGTINNLINHWGMTMEKKKVLKHIDTLYLYYSCDKFNYLLTLSEFAEKKIIGYANGYDWYDFGIARLGLMDYDKAKIANTYSIVIQYTAVYLLTIDIRTELQLIFKNDLKMYLIKRIDYSHTFNTSVIDFDFLDYFCVSPYFRKGSTIWGGQRKTETVYLGLRKSGKVFRLYNKTKELKDTKNHEKAQILNSYFGTTENLLVYEIELHRKYLRDRCGISSLNDLDLLDHVVNTLLKSLKFCLSTEKNLKLMKSKNYNKIEFIYPFVKENDFIPFNFTPVKKYNKSKQLMINKINNLIDSYNKLDGDNYDLTSLQLDLLAQMDKKDIISIDIEYDSY